MDRNRNVTKNKGSETQQKQGREGGRVAVLKGEASASGGDRRSETRDRGTGSSPTVGVSKTDNDGKGSGNR